MLTFEIDDPSTKYAWCVPFYLMDTIECNAVSVWKFDKNGVPGTSAGAFQINRRA